MWQGGDLVALGNVGAINDKIDPRPLGKSLEHWADGRKYERGDAQFAELLAACVLVEEIVK